MTTKALWLVMLFMLCIPALHADEANDLLKHLQQRFSKQVLVIRSFYGGSHLIFDSNGSLVKGDQNIGYEGCWCATQIQISKIEVKKDKLILRGPRIVGVYDRKKKQFTKLSREGGDIQVDIELGATQMGDSAIAGILDKVFLTRVDDVDSLIPDAWRANDFDPSQEVTRVKKDAASEKENVSPPKAIHDPDPEYSEEARNKKIAGDVLLSIVIDKKGKVARIRVERCLGAGLDQLAVEAVSGWTFEPAMRNGEPVAVQVDVDVNFHLY